MKSFHTFALVCSLAILGVDLYGQQYTWAAGMFICSIINVISLIKDPG